VSDTASPDAAANGAEPEPEAEEEAAAVEQLAVALFDFPPEEADDLGFVKGDIITVLQTDDDWWEGKLQNGDGCVPPSCTPSLARRPYVPPSHMLSLLRSFTPSQRGSEERVLCILLPLPPPPQPNTSQRTWRCSSRARLPACVRVLAGFRARSRCVALRFVMTARSACSRAT
jgi:hypothetical protein